jgi:hypothetical protein
MTTDDRDWHREATKRRLEREYRQLESPSPQTPRRHAKTASTRTPPLLKLITLDMLTTPLYQYAIHAPTLAIAIYTVTCLPLGIGLAKLNVTARKAAVRWYFAAAALNLLGLAAPQTAPSRAIAFSIVNAAFALYLRSAKIRDLFQAQRDPYRPKRNRRPTL